MTFSEYALGLSPFISYGKSEHDYFTELIGNFIKDAAMDSCQILKRKDDTKYRYIKRNPYHTTKGCKISLHPSGFG